MKMKTSVLAAAMTAALATGLVGEAAATEYGISRLYLDNLTVELRDDGVIGGGSVTSYNFNLINTAALNGSGVVSTAACSGNPSSTTCSAASPVLNATVVNAPLSTVLQGENTFTQNGPGAGSYANGDSVIVTSQLTMGQPSSTKQIAEAQIQVGDTSASASSEVTSTTGFSFQFTVGGADTMTITTDALLKILAEINDPTAASATAQANTELEFKLSKDGTNIFASFKPDGSGTNECLGVLGMTCTTLFDQFDLNTDVAVTGVPNSTSGRFNDGTNDHFGVTFGGLSDGVWTLLLTAKTSTSLSRAAVIPEPSVLALLGIGLVGLGAVRRRNRAKRM